MKLPQLSLTTKIANYFLLLALMTVGIVGGVAYFRAREALKQAAFDRLNVAATLKEAEITRWFEDQQRDFLQTTHTPDVQTNLATLLNSNIPLEKQQAYQALAQYLIEVNQIKPSLREIFILDRSNRIVLSTNKERKGDYQILANITYVEQVEVGANLAPIFYVSPITGKPAITLAKPLKNRQGMILVDLDLERIDRIVREKTGLGASGESYLVGSLISKNSFIAGKSKSTRDFSDSIDSAGIDAAMSGISGYGLYRNYAGNSVLGVYRWLNEQDIALLVEINQDEAFNPARKLASTIVLVGLISVFGLLIGVTWLSRQLEVLSCKQEIKQLAPGQPSYRLLVVDDRDTNRLALVKLLQSVGFEPRTANNGQEAIALWQDWQPDLIWMDMRMPIMDGYEASRTIKKHPQGKKTIIIALTASAFQEQKAKVTQAGCDDFVTKPFSEKIIFEKLTQHLGVKFISEVENLAVEPAKAKHSLTFSDLKSLSSALVSELNQAAIAVDADEIEQLITQIPKTQQHIAQEISVMLNKYDFDAIIELTEPR